MSTKIILFWKNIVIKKKKVDLEAEDQMKLEKYMKDLKEGKDMEKLK